MVNILLLKGYALLVEIIGCHGDQRLLQHELSRVQEGEGMKWEDTVLKDAYSEVDIPGDEGEGVIDITSRLEFQAEVSFKAGYEQRKGEDEFDWIWQDDGTDHLESLSCTVLIEANQLRDLIKAATREVVEWLEQRGDLHYNFPFNNISKRDWQAFLKEKGIEVKSE